MTLPAVVVTIAIVTMAATLVLGTIAWAAVRVRRGRAARSTHSAADGPWYFERHSPPSRGRSALPG